MANTVDWATVLRTGTVFGVVALTWLTFALLSPFFFTGSNIRAILTESSNVVLIATGLTVVVISGEIDLSIGAVEALAASLSAVAVISHGVPWYLGMVLGIAVGAAAGAVNGLVTWRLAIPSFIATLAMLGIAQGLAFLLTNDSPVNGFPSGYLKLGTSEIGTVPIAVLVALALVVAVDIMLHRTRLGRHIFAVGGNSEFARLSGISVGRVRLYALTLSGALAGVGGLILSSRLDAGAGDYGPGDLLPAVAAVVIGGTSLFGGVGSVWGTAAGVVLLTSITNGLIVINVADYWQQIAVGVIIIGAMAADRALKRGAAMSLSTIVLRRRDDVPPRPAGESVDPDAVSRSTASMLASPGDEQ